MKKMKKIARLGLFLLFLVISACDDNQKDLIELEAKEEVAQEEMPETEPELTSFNITITNVVNYLNAIVFNTHNNTMEPGPIPDPGCFYAIDFKAVPGTKLSFATMSVVSNDWFFAPSETGISLFEDGTPITGDVTDQIYLWDAGVEEENPATRTSEPGGAEAGAPDDDTTVRVVEMDVSSLIKVALYHDETTNYFTLKIENVAGKDDLETPIIITPGLAVLHAQNYPLFMEGTPDWELGLSKIAVQGNPTDLYNWFTATCDSGAPLRLSSSFTVLAPGVAYAFDSETDPVFTEGMLATAESGLEQIAEDGNNGVMFDYITNDLMLPAAKSNEMMPIGPGESLTFNLDVPVGHKLGYNTMFVMSNDWFFSQGNNGYDLFNGNGTPKSGTEATFGTYLFDAGTEVDQPVGMGMDQAPFQTGPNTGAADDNTTIRRVMEINDLQFGKGTISSEEGVSGYEDLRGGYNLVKVTIEPN
jgi:hypothetical protein